MLWKSSAFEIWRSARTVKLMGKGVVKVVHRWYNDEIDRMPILMVSCHFWLPCFKWYNDKVISGFRVFSESGAKRLNCIFYSVSVCLFQAHDDKTGNWKQRFLVENQIWPTKAETIFQIWWKQNVASCTNEKTMFRCDDAKENKNLGEWNHLSLQHKKFASITTTNLNQEARLYSAGLWTMKL